MNLSQRQTNIRPFFPEYIQPYFSNRLCLHSLVLSTLDQVLAEDPDRKCFRLIGGVLVERTVKDVTPALKTNRDGVCCSFNYFGCDAITYPPTLDTEGHCNFSRAVYDQGKRPRFL